ncbi:MAG TPA: hypothetical protein VGC76_14585 [Pyrinomonadaceae bacterium]|jgi:hypothetical protein
MEQTTPTPDLNASGKLDVQDIAITLGKSPTAIVYTTKDNQLRWRYFGNKGNLPNRLINAVSEFDTIMTKIGVSVPKSYKKEAYYQLGKSLFAALNCPGTTKHVSYFRDVKLFVAAKSKERGRFVYVAASMASILILALLISFSYFETNNIHADAALIELGGLFGAIGACISVLQRNNSLKIDPFVGIGYISFQGIARIFLGFIFGCIFVIASKANFILGVVGNTVYPLFILSIVAGFSERFIPELLSRFEAQNFRDIE